MRQKLPNRKNPKSKSIEFIVLAAGLGTRMKSDLPKVLHPVCGETMLERLLKALDASLEHLQGVKGHFRVVVGYRGDLVRQHVDALMQSGQIRNPVYFTEQAEQKGTGHAVRLALEASQVSGVQTDCIGVFNGDLPLFSPEAMAELWAAHEGALSSATLGAFQTSDPGAYGRVVRKSRQFDRVVEYKDATPKQRQISEVNGGVYLFDAAVLSAALQRVSSKNKAGEFYLTTVFELAKKSRKKIWAHCFQDPSVLLGVNNKVELASVQKLLFRKTADRLMEQGVMFQDPDATYCGASIEVGQGCLIETGAVLEGRTQIGRNTRIGVGCVLKDVVIGDDVYLKPYTVAENVRVGSRSTVGPMANLRPGSELESDVRVGNFVEIKESRIGSHTNAAHLSYIGDADIGKRVNVGCGFVTCNYDGTVRDGRRKHQSKIGDDVFIGSDSQVVAPIEIASGTFIASGSTVTESVPEPSSLVIARSRQMTKPGYAKKYKKGAH